MILIWSEIWYPYHAINRVLDCTLKSSQYHFSIIIFSLVKVVNEKRSVSVDTCKISLHTVEEFLCFKSSSTGTLFNMSSVYNII